MTTVEVNGLVASLRTPSGTLRAVDGLAIMGLLPDNARIEAGQIILLITAISYSLGRGVGSMCVALASTSWVGIMRLVRGEVLKHKGKKQVQAARVLGAGPGRIMFGEILPNVLHEDIVTSCAMRWTRGWVEWGRGCLKCASAENVQCDLVFDAGWRGALAQRFFAAVEDPSNRPTVTHAA